MSDDLVQVLRDHSAASNIVGGFPIDKPTLTSRAAARIEELEAKIEVLRLIALAYRYNKEMGDKLCEELGVDLGRQTNE